MIRNNYWTIVSLGSIPATSTGAFMASLLKGSPNSWFNITSIKVVMPSIWSLQDCCKASVSSSWVWTLTPLNPHASAIKKSCEDQKKGITTFIEVILNQELGEPFRRDAMKKPVRVAGIKKEDMKKQAALNN